MRLELTGVNTNKLHDELIDAGIIPQLVESLDSKTWITVDANQVDAVNEVVAAHDPTPIIVPDPDAELANAINAATTLDQLKAALIGSGKPARVKGKLKSL